MNWSLILFVVVVALFAWRGFRSGFVKSLARVLAVVAGYASAILFAGDVSSLLEARFALQGIVAFAVASAGLFLLAATIVMLVFWIVRRFLPGDGEISLPSAVGGSVVGALVGVLLAIVIVWSFAFLRDFAPGRSVEALASAPENRLEKFANRVAGSAVGAAMSASDAEPEVARISSALMENPAEVAMRTRRLMESAELQALVRDPRNRQILDSGKAELVRKLPAFRALVTNPDMVAMARVTGYGEGADMEAELAQQFTDIWARTQRVKNDARFQSIVNDPEFLATVQSGNPLVLMADPRLLELAEIIFEDDAGSTSQPGGLGGSVDEASSPEEISLEPKKQTEIHQWTDSSGRVHFSDKKPKQ